MIVCVSSFCGNEEVHWRVPLWRRGERVTMKNIVQNCSSRSISRSLFVLARGVAVLVSGHPSGREVTKHVATCPIWLAEPQLGG
jgi:hypothetical protein